MLFSPFGPRQVTAAFDGGEITSDAGVLLLRECERGLDLGTRMAGLSLILRGRVPENCFVARQILRLCPPHFLMRQK